MHPETMAIHMIDADGFEYAMKSAISRRDELKGNKKYWNRVIACIKRFEHELLAD